MLVSEFSYVDFLFALVVMKQQNQRAHRDVHVYTIYIQSSSLQISEERPIFLNQLIPNTQDFTFPLFHRKWCFESAVKPTKIHSGGPRTVGFSGKMVKKEKHVLGKLLYWHGGNMNLNVSQVPKHKKWFKISELDNVVDPWSKEERFKRATTLWRAQTWILGWWFTE